MKLRNLIYTAVLAFASASSLSSCSDENTPVPLPVSVTVQMPDEVKSATVTDEQFLFRNVTSGRTQVFTSAAEIQVTPGLYDITYTAHVLLPNGATSTMRAMAQSVNISDSSTPISLQAYNTIESDDLIIAEIFFTGTTTDKGSQHRGDDYIKLYNNTDHVIYADGISIFESNFNTTTKYDYTPDIMATDVAVWAVYTVPGDGTRFPVQPGEYFLIADNAYDHRTANPLSFDLSHARCEWFDESQVASMQDIDNLSVPNMDKVYCYTRSVFLLANGGNRAVGIARLGNTESFLTDNVYDYTYMLVTAAISREMTGSAYSIPNSKILDVVNCSTASGYAWNVTSPALDCGWTWCSENNTDKTRFFKSVRRKMLYLNDEGHPVLKDTNNSTDDFNYCCVPSEIELQGTAINADGTPATTITYDGVTPINR